MEVARISPEEKHQILQNQWNCVKLAKTDPNPINNPNDKKWEPLKLKLKMFKGK